MIQTDFRFSQQRRDDVADHTMSLMLYLFERVRTHGAGGFLANKVLGLIGFDGPAREIARRASMGLGMNVIVFDEAHVAPELLEACGCTQVFSVEDLLRASDFVSLHCTAAAGGQPLISAGRLNQMKPGACLINAAGQNLIEWQALVHALWFETIGGAAIDMHCIPAKLRPLFEDCPNAYIGCARQVEPEASVVTKPPVPNHVNRAASEVVVPLHPERAGV